MNILSYFKILIFNFLYGKIDGVVSAKSKSNIKITNTHFEDKKYNYKIFEIDKGILHNASVHDCAVISEKKIIDEASFQYRYNKKNDVINGPTSDNITTKIGTPRFRKSFSGSVFSMLTGGAGKNNYFHWLFDVLPRIGILENIKKIENPDFYLLPSLKFYYQQETLKELKIPISRLLSGEKNKHFFCDKLITVTHPYVFHNDPSESILNIPQWIIEWLRKKFILNGSETNNFLDKIYIDRSDSVHNKNRYIINNQEVRDCLKGKGFQNIILSKLSFADQVKVFNNAKIIVGLHGAGFSNIIFSNPGTKIIELQSSTAGKVIENLSIQCKHDYKKISKESEDTDLILQQGNIKVDIDELKKTILSM